MKNMVIRRNPEYAERTIKEYTSKGWRLMSNQRCQEIRGKYIHTFCELTFEGDDSLITEEEQREKDYYKSKKNLEQIRKENLQREISERPANFKKGVIFLIVGSFLVVSGIAIFIFFWLNKLLESNNYPMYLVGIAGLPFIIIGIVKMITNRKNRK